MLSGAKYLVAGIPTVDLLTTRPFVCGLRVAYAASESYAQLARN